MTHFDPVKHQQATAVFKLGLKASSKAVHRALNRPPRGKGWVQCLNSPSGVLCRPEKVRESIELFRKAYAIFPDIVVLNQIALAYEMLGERKEAKEHFLRMKQQAERETNSAYVKAADIGLARIA
jgi:tetratricopeptide (TPR) repeat protein